MPKFHYTAKNNEGKTIDGIIDAFSQDNAIETLQGKGFFITRISTIDEQESSQPKPTPKKKLASRKFHHNKIKLNDIISFCQQLVTMLNSGVTMLRSLQVILDQVESKKLFIVLDDVTSKVEEGSSLSEAMSNHPKVFNQFWVSLVEVGETAGTLPEVLAKLAFYLEQQAAFRSTIISAIIYPAILFCVCIGAISFFALFVGPRFENIFKSMNADLPLITEVLLAFFKLIKTNIGKIILAFIIGIFLLRKFLKTKHGKLQFEKFMLSLPIFGNIYRLIIVERFSSQMAILVDSGVPILQALDIASRLVDNITCAKIVLMIKERVRQGELLAAPMAESGFFPNMATQMITVGEETGELSKMLKHVATYYQQTVETFMKRLGTVIEPIMLVTMGAIIGLIVTAMFMPMFNLTSLAGGA